MELSFPSWAEVGLWDGFPAAVGRAPDPLVLALVDEAVNHAARKVQFVYTCDDCGTEHRPRKLADDYSRCERCLSQAIRLARSMKGVRRPANPYHGINDELASSVVERVTACYRTYFGGRVDGDGVLEVRNAGSKFRAVFRGGTPVVKTRFNDAVVRAAVCVPFLWDGGFDWAGGHRRAEYGRDTPIVPILHEWMSHCG